VDVARRAAAQYIVVHLGGVGHAIFEEERQLRRLYDEGVREGDHVESLRRNAAERRREGHARYWPNARKSLAEITGYASRFGIAVGLENRYHFHEFPNTDETHELLADYPPDVAGFWLDVGHAEVLERLGLADGHRWLNELAGRCIGTHVHDVDGLADHRAPGHGTADWDHFSGKLPPNIPRIFEINQKIDEEQVAASIPFLQERGVLPPARA
jgi:sugar phosphate isomerase/epimerase